MDEKSFEETLHNYIFAFRRSQAIRLIAENPSLLREEALMRIATMRANASAKGNVLGTRLLDLLDQKYHFLEQAIEISRKSATSECFQAYMEIIAFLSDNPELSYINLGELATLALSGSPLDSKKLHPAYIYFLQATLAMSGAPLDSKKLPPETHDDFRRAICCGLLARLKNPQWWDMYNQLLQQVLSKVPRRKYPESHADLCLLLGFGYLSTPTGDREVNLSKAMDYYQDALLYYQSIKPNSIEYVNLLGNMGVIFAETTEGNRFENLRRCVDCYQKALQILARIRAEPLQNVNDDFSAVNYNLAVSHLGLASINGDSALNTAIGYLKQVLEIDRLEVSPVNYALAQNCLGNAYRNLSNGDREENLQKAIDCYLTAFHIFEQRNMSIWCAIVAANLGRAYVRLAAINGEEDLLQQAIHQFGRALEFSSSDEDSSLVCEIQAGLAEAYGELARLTHSIEALHNAVQAFERSIYPYQPGRAGLDAFNSAQSLGDIAWEHKQLQIAIAGYMRAVEILDALLASATSQDQDLFIKRASGLYQRTIEVAYRLGLLDKCLVTVERAKGRLLLYELAQTDFRPPASVPYSMIEKERILLERRGALHQLLRQAEIGHTFVVAAPSAIAHLLGGTTSERLLSRSWLWRNLDVVESELQDLYRQMETIEPDYADIRRAATPSIEDIGRFVCDQGPGTTLVSYYLLPDSMLVLGLSSDSTEIVAEEIRKLERLIAKLNIVLTRESLDNPFSRKPNSPSDQEPRILFDLSADLLPGKIAQLLENTSRLYVIPTGPLHFLPFQALLWQGEPLLCHFPVIQSPSISVSIRAQKRFRGGRLSGATFGFVHDKEMKPIFEGEATRIAKLLGGTARVGRQCNRKNLYKLAKEAQVLHISSHGFFDPWSPLNSGVILADGCLTAREVMEKLRLPGSLVTLSACESGYNALEVGDELIGLMRAFFYAGASSLVLSLWSVDAPTTMELMVIFYESMRRGRSKAEALREASLAIRQSKPHPYYWAPFVLLGDWK